MWSRFSSGAEQKHGKLQRTVQLCQAAPFCFMALTEMVEVLFWGYEMQDEEVFELASKRLSGGCSDWQQFYNIYPFTTENISGYLDYFDLDGKSILTVGSSGDQMLNAILLGANEVTLLDINPFAKHYFYLKMAAIMELQMEEFLLFLRFENYPELFRENVMVFNEYIFNKIRDMLREINYETYAFWSNLFLLYDRKKIRKRLFSIDERQDKFIRACNLYLQNDSLFNKLKKNIENIHPEFINSDIINAKIDRKYDNIWLSNIATYGFSYESIFALLRKYQKHLNDNGQLLLSYLYDTTIDSKYDDSWDKIYNLPMIMKMLGNENIAIKSFIGTYGIVHDIDKIKDSVLVHKKIKTK